MILKEIKIRTRKELVVLFEKLERNDFKWSSGKPLIAYNYIVDEFPAYIHMHENNNITWGTESIPESSWKYCW